MIDGTLQKQQRLARQIIAQLADVTEADITTAEEDALVLAHSIIDFGRWLEHATYQEILGLWSRYPRTVAATVTR